MTQLEMGMEGLVDKFGLQAIMHALATVCCEKEAHIAENWQDMGYARVWRSMAAGLTKLAKEAPIAPGSPTSSYRS